MPKIDLCFSGWVRNAEVVKATTVDGKAVDVTDMESSELASKLRAGELFVSLAELLDETDDTEIELFDFEESF
mgnify:CR=1 FL=1|jgi:hypothetical protein